MTPQGRAAKAVYLLIDRKGETMTTAELRDALGYKTTRGVRYLMAALVGVVLPRGYRVIKPAMGKWAIIQEKQEDSNCDDDTQKEVTETAVT